MGAAHVPILLMCATNEEEVLGREFLWLGAVQVMKVWPFGAALRGEASNHLKVR